MVDVLVFNEGTVGSLLRKQEVHYTVDDVVVDGNEAACGADCSQCKGAQPSRCILVRPNSKTSRISLSKFKHVLIAYAKSITKLHIFKN